MIRRTAMRLLSFFTITLSLTLVLSVSGNLLATDLEVLVKGIKQKNVKLYISICNEKNFESENPDKDCYINQQSMISEKKDYIFRFKDIQEGEWTIFGYVDEDNNGKINTTIFGIPTEDVFYSADVTPFFFKGSPSFNKIKSIIKGDKQTIELSVQ